MPVASFRAGVYLSINGAPSRGCKFCLALMAVNCDAVGCQKARSGLSPDATFVCTLCSYGSGTVTMLIFAPVAVVKSSATFLATVLLFCAAQMVRFTPSSFAVCSGQEAGAPESALPVPAPGSLQPAISSATTAAAINGFRILFIGRPSSLEFLPGAGGPEIQRYDDWARARCFRGR